MRVLSIATAVPPWRYTQEEVHHLTRYQKAAALRLFENTGVENRYLALDPEHQLRTDPQWFSDHYAKWSVELGHKAAQLALENAGVKPAEIDAIFVCSCTGYLCPGLNQILAKNLGLNSDIKSANHLGMGCNAVVPTLERAHDFLKAHPQSKILVVAVEICSATYWVDENDAETMVGNGLFSDGASAVVLSLDGKSNVDFLAFASRANREFISSMGYHNANGRLKVMLSKDIPTQVMPLVEEVVVSLLKENKLTLRDVSHWVVHPGGKRILDSVEVKFNLSSEKLESSRTILKEFGNLSSASLLFVLKQEIETKSKQGYGLFLGMGPGLSVEGALITF